MKHAQRALQGGAGAVLGLVFLACTPARYVPSLPAVDLRVPHALTSVRPGEVLTKGGEATARSSKSEALPTGPLTVDEVIAAVTQRYPPYLSALLERDLASGRLVQAMGGFDTKLGGKVGSRLQGYYEATTAEAFIEQPLATGDSIYGGYRISDGQLPDYYDARTQDDGQVVLGVRVPLLRGRATDARRASVRKAEIGVEGAAPEIARARIAFVRAASQAYFGWEAAGRKVAIARDLLRLAEDRQAGLRRGVEREFLPEVTLVDNERLITQRRVFVTRAERAFEAAALGLSLYYRADDDQPIVAGEARLPPPRSERVGLDDAASVAVARALRERPELERLAYRIDAAETDRALAENDVLPSLDLLVEANQALSQGPYKDLDDFGFFVGGKLELPIQRRAARGRLRVAELEVERLRIEKRFLEERIVNEILDARSALENALSQLDATERNVVLARELVAAEQRAFELGRSDLLRIQLREAQLADAQILAVDARLGYERSLVDYRAALGESGPGDEPQRSRMR